MTAARRLPAVVWAVAAVALWLAWSAAEVGAGPLEPTLCPVGSADPACAQPVVNRPPDAVDDEVRSRPGRTIRTNVLGNDSDPDGDALTVRPNRNRTFAGTFSFAADGAFAYTPRYGFAGTDSVSYEVSDGRGASDAATVWVHVENARPVVQDEHFTIRPGETLRGNLLANDVDPDGDTMSVTSRFDVKRDGSFTYTPAPGFIGRDGGGYAVEDQYGLIAGGRIVIEVVKQGAGRGQPPLQDPQRRDRQRQRPRRRQRPGRRPDPPASLERDGGRQVQGGRAGQDRPRRRLQLPPARRLRRHRQLRLHDHRQLPGRRLRHRDRRGGRQPATGRG
jgi:Bacterial Ig domain